MDRYLYLGTLYYLTSVYLRRIGALFIFFYIILYTHHKIHLSILYPSVVKTLLNRQVEFKFGGTGTELYAGDHASNAPRLLGKAIENLGG